MKLENILDHDATAQKDNSETAETIRKTLGLYEIFTRAPIPKLNLPDLTKGFDFTGLNEQLRKTLLATVEPAQKLLDESSRQYLDTYNNVFDAYKRLARAAIPELNLTDETDFTELLGLIQKARPQWIEDIRKDLQEAQAQNEANLIWEGIPIEEITLENIPLHILGELLENEIKQRDKQRHQNLKRKSETRIAAPQVTPQITSPEMYALGSALADGPSQHRWEPIIEESAMVHSEASSTHQVRLTVSSGMNDWWDAPGLDHLQALVAGSGKQSYVLACVCFYWLFDRAQYRDLTGVTLEITTTLDDLIEHIGRGDDARRSKAKREEWRQRVWEWLLLFEGLKVIGTRKGKYTDSKGKPVMLMTRDAMIRITGKSYNGQQVKLDGSTPPHEVTWVPGPWFKDILGLPKEKRSQIIQNIGNVYKIGEIPAGKPSGDWAQSIGLALNQYWREWASRTNVVQTGETEDGLKRQTVHLPNSLTRDKLLSRFRCDPWVEDVLSSPNPHRAQEYWKEAIQTLVDQGVISYYAESDFKTGKMSSKLKFGQWEKTSGLPRQGWAEFWLYHQKLDIRPKEETTVQIKQISQTAIKRKRKQKTT